MKLQKKFLLTTLLVSAVPLLIYFIYTYHRYNGMLLWQTQQTTDNLMAIVSSYADNALKTIDHITEAVHLPDKEQVSLADRLKKYDIEQPVNNTVTDNQHMKSIYQSYFYNYNYINGIFIITPNGQILSYSNGISFRNDYSASLSPWFEKAVE